AQSALTVSETTFGRDFNEALVHQGLLLHYAAGEPSRVLVLRRLVLKSLGSGKKTMASRKTTVKKLTTKRCIRGALKSILSETGYVKIV
ncbi:unnamed protein product, partial [Ranitomeya imitator]